MLICLDMKKVDFTYKETHQFTELLYLYSGRENTWHTH